MNFKPGDRVRFLNTTGGGVVKKNINSFMVSVAIEDGFEIPTLVSELVLIEQSNSDGKLFTREHEAVSEIPPPTTEKQNKEEFFSDKLRKDDPMVPRGVYLAYIPHDQQWIMTGKLDLCLLNHTDYEILYSIFLKDDEGNFSGVDYGSLEKQSRVTIESIVRDDIAHWSSGIVQVLFHTDETDKVLMPVSSNFRVKGASFFKEGSFKDYKLLDNQKAILLTICELNRLPSTVEHVLMEKEDLSALPESARQFNPGSAIDRYRIAPREAEVDLHISALRDNYDHLSAREILSIQTATFEKMLESALANNYTRVVFIHGVGNGSLKNELINRIRDYEDIEFRNASFAKYGNGAIEIILHQNM